MILHPFDPMVSYFDDLQSEKLWLHGCHRHNSELTYLPLSWLVTRVPFHSSIFQVHAQDDI